jgi:hypothetical protein
LDTLVDFDTDWHTYHIYRTVTGAADFQIDDNSFESLVPPYVPTSGLHPWLMSYARMPAPWSRFEVDWVRVRSWCGADANVTVGDEEALVTEVQIDIKPGSDPNSINPNSKGVVPVAVLTTDDFDASTVDPDTVLFAGAMPLRWAVEDVDGDGDVDLLFHFKTQELDLDDNSPEATLSGESLDGVQIEGTDTVNIVPKGK